MALVLIPIAADGNTLPVNVNHGDHVRWQATAVNGVFPVWYVIFPSPFLDHVISTGTVDGQTPLFKVRKSKGFYLYMISAVNDPTSAQMKRAEEGGIKPVRSGGGIIIDS